MDKFILITGGTKGIGKAVASCLGKAGYNLILTYASDQAAAEEVRSEYLHEMPRNRIICRKKVIKCAKKVFTRFYIIRRR